MVRRLMAGAAVVVTALAMSSVSAFAAPVPVPQSDFTLYSVTASPSTVAQGGTVNLAIDVEQTSVDGSDNGATHAFPGTVTLTLTQGSVTKTVTANWMSGGPIDEPASGKNASPTSAIGEYSFVMPGDFSKNSVTIQVDAGFRMGPTNDISDSDDLVDGTTSVTGTVTVTPGTNSQLPEVPFAAALPLAVLGAAAVVYRRMKR